MSSGFVSAGTDQEPIERDEEWLRVQQELEEERRRKAELGKQDGGKSLYEVLQQNKMAKQEAFEERIKLKNQFRSLDEDEVEFLDSIMESTRAQEAAVKKETAEQLELFRRQREEAEKTFLEEGSADVAPTAEGEDWKIPARKRRRDKTKDLLVPGKKRKSTTENPDGASPPLKVSPDPKGPKEKNQAPADKSQDQTSRKVPDPESDSKTISQEQTQDRGPVQPPSLSLGLAGYDSDSE
ncbi:N-terminal domain of NEFA-interacting nuclear protein NIP30-domain-containing protein [Aspergillus ambiguus]|uniref:N-terminal domain of NEFA-interacting nuclear protein NIP30-domain-containing protein n=1 Tax=Aspergillus ambiguus TaxID=176160 RepID=UPI003CCCD571